MTGVLVHEWIAQTGGSENVLQAMSEAYPTADIRCLWDDSLGRFDSRRINESWIARTPLRRRKDLALPLMPLTWRLLRDRDYDWALISSHAFAHHAKFRGAKKDFRRLVYVHTPARYVWSQALDSRGARFPARAASRVLKPLDRKRANEGAEFAANSKFVRQRIRDSWEIDAHVIYPPVRVDEIQAVLDWRDRLSTTDMQALEELPREYILGASRFIPYKRLEDVIRVGEIMQLPVVLAGEGPSSTALKDVAKSASVPVHFVSRPSGPLLYALYQQTQLYVFPGVEDFGIMPVEAMAAGSPVLAQSLGGASESVIPNRTGALTDFLSDADIEEAARIAVATLRADRVEVAKAYSQQRFIGEIRAWVGDRKAQVPAEQESGISHIPQESSTQ